VTTTATTTAVTAAATTSEIRSGPDVGTEDVSPFMLKRLSDESLGSRLAAGEAAAFDELYRRYVHRLAAYGSHLLGDAAAGDDVAQSALLKAYGALREGRVPDKMRPWLYRIAHNTAIDLVVRRRELPSDEVPELAAREPEPMAGALVAALAALPERQRQVYVLRELHGMRIAETCGELGLTTTQVEQALFAARNRLAELLVFGDRLDCMTVQRLAAGPLDGDERRALKTHLRSCAGCRAAVGLRGRALGWLPAPSFEWLRGLLVGGAAPAAAKVGAVVVTATVAAGVPAASEQVHMHVVAPKPRRTQHVVHVVHVTQTRTVVFHAPALTPAATAPAPVAHEEHAVERHESSGESPQPTADRSRSDGGGTQDGSPAFTEPTTGDGGSGGGGARPAATAPAPASTSDGSDSSGHDGSNDGGGTVTTVPAAPLPALTTTTSDGRGSGDSGGEDGDR